MGSSAKRGKFLIRGSQEQKHTFLVQNIKVPFGIGHPHLHIKCSLYVCRRVQRSQIFKQNWIILIRSSFIAYLVIWAIPALVGGWVGVGVGESRYAPTCPYIHAQAHMHMHMCNTKIYMYSNCKWPPPWRHPCLSCLTCMCVCACIHACMHACTCVFAWGTTIHPHSPTHPSTHRTHPQGGWPPKSVEML